MQLSIIIVNYKSTQLILDCIQTVYKETSSIFFEIIVVDNNSGDDSERILKDAFPGIRYIQMGYNAGFARANNEAIRKANGDAVLLLNGDTLVRNRAIEGSFIELSKSSYVACGVQLLNNDGSPQISGNYVMKGGLNYLLPLPYLGSLLKGLGNLFKVSKPNVENAESIVEVDWINGAYLMVKKAAIEQAGLLDEDFFLYAEEAEWCSRLKKKGKLCIYGQYKVVHLQGETANAIFGSTGKGYYNLYDRKGLQIMVSNFLRIRKQFGVVWFLVQLFFYTIEIPLFLLGVLIEKIAGDKQFSIKQFNGYASNVIELMKLSPLILRNKPHFYKVL